MEEYFILLELQLGYNISAKEDSKSVIDIEKDVIDVDDEPRLKDIGPQVVGSLRATNTTRSARNFGIRKAKEIEGREEIKKMKSGASHDPSGFEYVGGK